MPNAAPKTQQTPAGRTVWHHVGRVFLNPTTGKFVYVGYLVHIDPINGSLFNGSPSESTAYFTFSTDLAQLTPLPNNNDVALDLVSAGTFSVYYNATPAADWSNPASFSSGKLIATFHRKESLFADRAVAFHSLSETLMWSSDFEFDGQTYNFNRIAPNGITFAQFFSTAPQAGTADYPVTFQARALCLRSVLRRSRGSSNRIWPNAGRVLDGSKSSARSREVVMAHIGVFTATALGHMYPSSTLALELKKRGHRVTFFAILDALDFYELLVWTWLSSGARPIRSAV